MDYTIKRFKNGNMNVKINLEKGDDILESFLSAGKFKTKKLYIISFRKLISKIIYKLHNLKPKFCI